MAAPFDPERFVSDLKTLVAKLPSVVSAPGMRRLKQLRDDVAQAVTRLDKLRDELDAIRQPDFFFDPSNPHVVGRFIAKTLLEQKRVPLATIKTDKFYGSGVYALYYNGPFPAYAPARGKETPLYVGKVDPATHDAHTAREQGAKLWGRLNGDHARSITAASNLDVKDFDCRYLVVRSAWQNTAESYLINLFKPIWNNEVNICYGIGKHGDAATTRANTRSPWDTVHPGRNWAGIGNVPNPKSAAEIMKEIAEHYRRNPPK